MNKYTEAGISYDDYERMQTMHRAPTVFRHVDYEWAMSDKMVRRVVAGHIAVIAHARRIPETLDELRALDTLAVNRMSASRCPRNRAHAATAARVGGLACYYAALIYRAIRLGEDSCELAGELQVTPWAIRQVLFGLHETAQKIAASRPLLRKYRAVIPKRAHNRPGPHPKFDVEQAAPLRLAGLTLKAIALKFDVTEQGLGKAFKNAGITLPGGKKRARVGHYQKKGPPAQ